MNQKEINKAMDLKSKMRFRVIDNKDNSDVLGGPVEACNSHLLNIVQFLDHRGCHLDKIKAITDLNLNESLFAQFKAHSPKGEYGVYKVVRVA